MKPKLKNTIVKGNKLFLRIEQNNSKKQKQNQKS